MKELENIVGSIESEMDEKDTVREIAIKSSRALVRLSSSAIRAIHNGNDEEAEGLIKDTREEANQLRGLLSEHPDLYYSGFIENATQEMAEANILYSIIKGIPFLTPKDLGITPSAYVLGLGDVVGELRRFALNAMREGDVETAVATLEKMELIYNLLLRFDFPNGLIAVRRKQDVARSIVEKTRGEIAVAVRGQALEKRLEELTKRLEK